MKYALRWVWLALVLGVVACGGAAGPPKAESHLVVGPTKTAEPMPVAAAPTEVALEEDLPVPVSIDDPVRGSRLAPVTIVLFSDFQCPFCSRLATTFEQVEDTYKDDVRIVWKHEPLPFHQHARLAAEVGQAVFITKGSEAFFRFHDMAFRRQRLMSPEAILAWAQAAGADTREVDEGSQARRRAAEKVARDEALAKRLGATGTPAAFVNGVSVSGAQPFEKWKEVIDAELAKAKDLAARGVPKDRVYSRLVVVNFKEKGRGDDDDDDDKGPPPPDMTVWKVPVGTSPVRGKADALVTMVMFSDFQCPYCKRVEPTIEQLRRDYGDRLRVVWKDQPLSFHPRAMPAALFARSARQQKGDPAFWTVHDKIFDAQPKLEDSDLEAIARASGIDAAKAMAAVRGKTFAKAIEDDVGLADDVQASGTPHFFINGRRLVGAQAIEKFKDVIDAELAKAEALVRGGVARTALYETIIKDGKSAPEPERKAVALPSFSVPFRGAANAKVVIQEFSDFQCPFCKRVEPTIDELLKAYPGKVKVVWRNKPLAFHADAPLAAEAAREAFVQKGNDGFSKMRELLFAHQSDPDGLKRTALESYAKQVGLDAKKFGKALDDRTHKASIDADAKAADDGGIQGTPGFTIGPYFLSGAQPLAKFKKLVERVLSEPAGGVAGAGTGTGTGTGTGALPPGLVVTDLVVGSGAPVKSGDKVRVHYVGTLTNGTEFDSSRKHGAAPFSVEIGKGMVIKGWDAGLIGMKVGGKRKLTIPPDLAYGDRGAPPTVPPRATLIFEIELLGIQ